MGMKSQYLGVVENGGRKSFKIMGHYIRFGTEIESSAGPFVFEWGCLFCPTESFF